MIVMAMMMRVASGNRSRASLSSPKPVIVFLKR